MNSTSLHKRLIATSGSFCLIICHLVDLDYFETALFPNGLYILYILLILSSLQASSMLSQLLPGLLQLIHLSQE